jgi:hypothetical protein
MIDTDSEFKRRGFFKRIFPCVDFLYYKQFFEEDRPLNYLIDAKVFSKKRGTNQAMLRKNQAMPFFMMKGSSLMPEKTDEPEINQKLNSRGRKPQSKLVRSSSYTRGQILQEAQKNANA